MNIDFIIVFSLLPDGPFDHSLQMTQVPQDPHIPETLLFDDVGLTVPTQLGEE